MTAGPPRYEVIKTYPRRGPVQQRRLVAATAFACFRCGQSKKSKLVTVFHEDWDRLLCNGCYGRLLSIYEVRAGTGEEHEKAAALAQQLLSLVSKSDLRRAEEHLRLRDHRADNLGPGTVRLLATSDFVAEKLANATDLDWSAAIIGQCKAVEVELVERFVEPLADACTGLDLAADLSDKDLGRVARYCARRSEIPPELGAVRHFLHTAAHSRKRQASSVLLMAVRDLLRNWPHGDWLLAKDGAPAGIGELSSRYRNRAAHTDELTQSDYAECAEFVSGNTGLLWSLVRATSSVK